LSHWIPHSLWHTSRNDEKVPSGCGC
jgi:hypothetical protein